MRIANVHDPGRSFFANTADSPQIIRRQVTNVNDGHYIAATAGGQDSHFVDRLLEARN